MNSSSSSGTRTRVHSFRTPIPTPTPPMAASDTASCPDFGILEDDSALDPALLSGPNSTQDLFTDLLSTYKKWDSQAYTDLSVGEKIQVPHPISPCTGVRGRIWAMDQVSSSMRCTQITHGLNPNFVVLTLSPPVGKDRKASAFQLSEMVFTWSQANSAHNHPGVGSFVRNPNAQLPSGNDSQQPLAD
ncbi:hypothetical protein CRG98_028776 [Punica granatum]|uniref:Uncharacterized protein n=1 Tax=Punica granatum TaxID=22663 RepID=A0A2I0J3I5_PUNGR|nr:hypothetical protein CRG98_028776 [Punica granatum]